MSTIIEKDAIATEDDLINDLIEEDDMGYECELCDFAGPEMETLLKHIKESHETADETPQESLPDYDENCENTTVKYMCSLCFKPFSSIQEVKSHMIRIHKLKEKSKKPPATPATPAAPQSPSKSSSSSSSSSTSSVDHSEILNLSMEDLKKRLQKLSIHRCDIKGCVYKFETTEQRDIHLKCHSSYSAFREFKCCECGKEQMGWRHCSKHLWKMHHIDVDLLKCPICPFNAKNTLKIFQHLQEHGGNKGFPCPVCSKVFPNHGQLRKHSLTHEDVQKNASNSSRWYSQKTCQICLNVFANSKTLTKHMKRHNKILSYRCNICGKGSTNKSTWLIHMRQHTGEKPLKCKVCPFNARDPSVMRKHTLGHMAQKPYKCKVCDFSAIQTVGIKKHIRLNHPEEYEKMKCSLCKFISVSQELLERHSNDHKAGLVRSEADEAKESEHGAASKLHQSRQRDHMIKPSEVSSDCFLPLESIDPHDPPLDIGGVTIPANSEDAMFN